MKNAMTPAQIRALQWLAAGNKINHHGVSPKGAPQTNTLSACMDKGWITRAPYELTEAGLAALAAK